MGPLEAVRLGPHCVGRLALLSDPRIGIAEDEPDVEIGVERFDALHLLAIARLEQPFGLHDDPVLQEEVGGVLVGGLGLGVRQEELLEGERRAGIGDLLGDLLFKT